MSTPDPKTQIAALMVAYEKYVKGKTTGQGITDNRTAKEQADAKSQKAAT